MNRNACAAARTLSRALAAGAVLLAPSARRLSPLALAAVLALGATPALSVDVTFFGHDTLWNTPTNWGGNVLPGPADNARLGNYDVDLYGSASVRSFSGTGALSIYGSLNLGAAESSIGRLYVNGGTLTATGAAVVTASMASYWSGGTIGSANNNVLTFFNDGLTFNGASNHQLVSSTMNLSAHSAWYDNAQITLNRSTLNNVGTFDDANTGNASLISLSASDAFNNAGIYLKTGAGTSTVGTDFNNSGGSLVVNAGALVLSRGVQYGSVSVANGATLSLGANSSVYSFDLTNGTLTGAGTLAVGSASTWVAGALTGTGGTVFNAGLAISGTTTKTIDQRSVTLAEASSWSGNGSIVLSNGAVLTNNGSFNDQNTNAVQVYQSYLSGYNGSTFINAGSYTKSGAGTTTINTAFSNTGTLAVNAGQLYLVQGISGSGSASVASGATLTVASVSSLGRLNLNGGTLQNQAALSVGNASTWSGGVMSGTGSITFSGGLAISGTAKGLSQSSLNLAGASSWSGNGETAFHNGAVLTNNGSFTDQNTGAAVLSSFATGNRFVNAGTYTKSGAGTTYINTPFSNGGTLAVNAGVLNFNGAVSGSGSASVASGATLSFRVDSSIGSLNLNDGTLTGAGALTVSNASTWTGGTMSGSGSSTFSNGLAISGTGKALDQRGLILAGASSWAGNGNIAFYDGAVLTNNGSFADQNAGSVSLTSSGTGNRFVNAGTYTKSGAGTTFINTAFTNNGTLAVNAGSLYMNGAVSGSGSVNLTGGTLSLGAAPSIGSLNLSGGALTWAGALSVSNASTWTGGTMSGYGTYGSSTFSGGLAISSGAAKTLDWRYLNLAGASSWSGNGSVAFSNGAVLTNNGSFADQNTGAASLGSSGAGNSFVNAGTYTKSGAGTTTINTAFTNNGTLAVNAGWLSLNGGVSYSGNGLGSASVASGATLSLGSTSSLRSLNLNGGTLTGAGALSVSNASTWSLGTMSGTGSSTFSGGLALSGAAKTLDQRHLILAGASSWSGNGTITFSNGAVLTNNGSFADQNTVGASLNFVGAGTSFVNAGTYTKSGAGATVVRTDFANSGTLAVNAGTLDLIRGVSGSGSVTVASGATLSLGANSTVGSMAKAGTLALGANNLSVAQDYNNTGSGVGNAFNRHAGVTGTGQILAQGSVKQTLSGASITLGDTANAVLTLATTRVGDAPITTSFKINNLGSGASLRGAIQTGGISSAALSGSGVTAQNWGAVAAGGSTGAYTITYSPTVAGQSLAGQSLSIVNNFDNVAGQTLSFAGGKVYAPAVAQLGSSAMNFGIVHVGDTVGGGVTVRNAAAVAGLNDVLLGTASGGGGAFVVGGSLAGLAAGGQDSSSLKVGLDTSRAGVYRGTADLAFASHNADMSDLALGSQQLALSAQVNNYAQVGLSKAGGAGSLGGGGNIFTLDFGTVTQGDVARRALLVLFNSASGPADLLSGSFDLSDFDPAHNFTLGGFGAFGGLEAGDELAGLSVSFGSYLLGAFDEWIVLHAAGSNASGYNEALGDVRLHLIGSVTAGVLNAVPEPGTYALVLGGLLSLVAVRRRQCKRRQADAIH